MVDDKEKRTMCQWQLTMHSYCGMHLPVDYGDREKMRDTVAEMLRKHRRSGRWVDVRDKGHRWELCEAEDSGIVNDYEGILSLREV